MRKLCIVFATLLTASGCATSRGVVDIRIPPSLSNSAAPAVRIEKVTDRRTFQIKPPQPSIPSLKGD
jgi:uncharacterized protein YceK